MPDVGYIVKYLFLALILIGIGISIGYTISDAFGFPYWSTVLFCASVVLTAGLSILFPKSGDKPDHLKDNNMENEDKSNEDSRKVGENSESDSPADGVDMTDSQIDKTIPEMGEQKNSKYSVGKSNEEVLEEQVDRINDLVTVLEGDIIRIDNKYKPDPYRKMLLYVIAARYSFEEGYRESPAVSSEELKSYFRYESADIDIFIRRLPSVLKPHTGLGFPNYDDLDGFSFTVEASNIERAIDWSLDDNLPTGPDVRLSFGYARMALENAREKCQEIKNREEEKFPPSSSNISASNTYSSVEYEIKESVHDVRDYPIFNEDDVVWRDFMRTADTALRRVQENSVGGILHCIGRMEKKLDSLESRHENSIENR